MDDVCHYYVDGYLGYGARDMVISMKIYAPAVGTDMNRNDLIISYFNIGYTSGTF